jgi:hypothetical protein
MAGAWNNWFHIIVCTYGSWLHGDKRGWRTRHHREHVEGDYRNPPDETDYARPLHRTLDLMSRAPVRLDAELHPVVCRMLADALIRQQVELIELSVSASHVHGLMRFTPLGAPDEAWRSPRMIVGVAKGRVAHDLAKQKLVASGGVWGKRCKVAPIADREHQVTVVNYIRRHEREGAAIWTKLPPPSDSVSATETPTP